MQGSGVRVDGEFRIGSDHTSVGAVDSSSKVYWEVPEIGGEGGEGGGDSVLPDEEVRWEADQEFAPAEKRDGEHRGLEDREVRVLGPGIIHVCYAHRYWMTSSWMRLQEYYESPLPGIRGEFFTHETFMDLYADSRDGRMDYFDMWAGFNVPGHIVDDFSDRFDHDLSMKERKLFADIFPHRYTYEKFYVIATLQNGECALRHEVAHGLYYLDQVYQNDMKAAVQELPKPVYRAMRRHLLDLGYDESTIVDEIHAYLIDDNEAGEFEFNYGVELPESHKWFQRRFSEALTKHGIVLKF